MPFVINYTDANGTAYPESFWIINTVSLNHLARTGVIIVNGYGNVASYNSGATAIGEHVVVFNDVNIYDTYIKWELETNGAGVDFSFYWYLEQAILAQTNFFVGNVQYSVAEPRILEIGAEADNRVAVAYSNELTGYASAAGVTIKINGVPVTISAAGADANYIFPAYFGVYYDIATTPLAGDVVTWQYDGGSPGVGTLTDPGLLPVRKFAETAVSNTLGRRAKFNVASNSGHIVTLGL